MQLIVCMIPFPLQTPLHFAAASTHGGICLEILVSEGANTKAQVSYTYSVLFVCLSLHLP